MSVARALDSSSVLRPQVKHGKQGLRGVDRRRVSERPTARVVDSLDLDSALRSEQSADPRWDYLLGTSAAGRRLIALEVHPANTGEARVVVKKKRAATAALREHLAPGERVARWYWVASGSTKITANTPEARLLNQAGIILVGSQLASRPLSARCGVRTAAWRT